jgi:YVTN family beta-propeller protein
MLTAAAVFVAIAACGENGPGQPNGTHPSLASIDSVPLAGRPYGVAISKQGEVYVALLAFNSIARTTLAFDSFAAPVLVGQVPPHVVFSPAGNRAYATNQTGQSMSVIDVSSGTTITTVPLTADGFNLIASRDGKQVFVSVSTGQVYVVDASSNAIVDSIMLLGAVNGFARHPKKNLVYISSRDGGRVYEVDVASHQVLRTFMTGGKPQRLAVSPDGKQLLIANEMLGLDLWSLRSGTRDTTLAVSAYGLGLSPDGVDVYVAGGPGGLITIVDRVGRAVDTVLTVGGTPRNVAFDASGQTAVISNEADFLTVVR